MRPDARRPQRLYRDPHHGKLMGVCAGMADYFGWNVTLIRIIAIIALLWFHVVALIAYFALGFLLPTKPDRFHDQDTDEKYWRSARRSTDHTFRRTRPRFGKLDVKLQPMEGYVTSSRYDLDREFRDLEH